MSGNHVLRIRLSLKGRPLKTYTFDKPLITVGRDPSSDIVLDNVNVSREHVRFELSPTGYYSVEDTGSSNGTFLNDQPVKRDYVYNNDVVRVGKYSLWISFQEDRRERKDSSRPLPDADQGTTVLSEHDLKRLMESARESEKRSAQDSAAAAARRPGETLPGRGSAFIGALVFLAFLLGTAVGAGATWLLVK